MEPLRRDRAVGCGPRRCAPDRPRGTGAAAGDDPGRPRRPGGAPAAGRRRRRGVRGARHARREPRPSSPGALGELDTDELDLAWAVNVRATLLLVQAFAAQCPPPGAAASCCSRPGSTVDRCLRRSRTRRRRAAADHRDPRRRPRRARRHRQLPQPGPTDTGWALADTDAAVARAMPCGRWNTPDEAASVVALLLSDDAATITGQVIDARGEVQELIRGHRDVVASARCERP